MRPCSRCRGPLSLSKVFRDVHGGDVADASPDVVMVLVTKAQLVSGLPKLRRAPDCAKLWLGWLRLFIPALLVVGIDERPYLDCLS